MVINNKKAFTLVELIVVITILAILGTIAFISLQGYSKSSRDSVRISDVSNMKTSLELFHLNAGKYPLPDNYGIVNYNSQDLWYQGTFGNTVVSQLSRNINEIPTDSLSDKEYIYSVANNKNEFEILNLLEGDLALNSINQTNAAGTSTRLPRIDGQYNGVFIKTATDIVPTPSIITSENVTGLLTLDVNNIKSQIITGGENIPNIGSINSATGKLNITLSVYNGTINKDSLDSDKALLMQKIQTAYSGSTLANNYIYALILSKSTTQDLAALVDSVVLKSSEKVATPTITNSCDDTTKPADDLNKDYTVNPTSVNQSYVQNSDECGYACTSGYTGTNCEIAPDPWNDGESYFTFGTIITYSPSAVGITTIPVGGNGGGNEYCNNLVLGGASDWHLPTKTEAQFLADNFYTLGAPSCTGSCIGGAFRTATPGPAGGSYYYTFKDGPISSQSDRTHGYWCVRIKN